MASASWTWRFRRLVGGAAVAVLAVAAMPVALGSDATEDEQPGDELPPEDDTASYKSCGAPPDASSGSRIIRVTPAGPRRDDGSLAFAPGVCVYLPPGYDDGTERFPVIYSFHGGGGQQRISFAGVLDQAAAADPDARVIVVGPDGSGLAAWFDRFDDNNTSVQNLNYSEQGPAYRRTLNETYVLDWLVPYVDLHFRTIPTREGRALQGISNGGHGAALLTAKRPDMFTVTSVLSGNVAWQSVTMSQEMFLDVETAEYSPTYRAGHIPANLTPNLAHNDMIFDIGTTCPAPTVEDPLRCRGDWEFEQLFVQGNRELQLALAQTHEAVVDYRETEGAHASVWWRQWYVERHLPFMLARLADPQPLGEALPAQPAAPSSFRYVSVDTAFDAWGYALEVQRDVREFLELRVAPDAISLTGSGSATVTTPPAYAPGASYVVEGAGGDPVTVAADDAGRLSFTVDLGPSNQQEDPRWIGDTGLMSQPVSRYFTPNHPSVTRVITISEAA